MSPIQNLSGGSWIILLTQLKQTHISNQNWLFMAQITLSFLGELSIGFAKKQNIKKNKII